MKIYLNKIKETVKKFLINLQSFIIKVLLFLTYFLGFGLFCLIYSFKKIKPKNQKKNATFWERPQKEDKEDLSRQS